MFVAQPLHVQFTDDPDQFGHDSDIGVHNANDFLINVHLGFLQVIIIRFFLFIIYLDLQIHLSFTQTITIYQFLKLIERIN